MAGRSTSCGSGITTPKYGNGGGINGRDSSPPARGSGCASASSVGGGSGCGGGDRIERDRHGGDREVRTASMSKEASDNASRVPANVPQSSGGPKMIRSYAQAAAQSAPSANSSKSASPHVSQSSRNASNNTSIDSQPSSLSASSASSSGASTPQTGAQTPDQAEMMKTHGNSGKDQTICVNGNNLANEVQKLDINEHSKSASTSSTKKTKSPAVSTCPPSTSSSVPSQSPLPVAPKVVSPAVSYRDVVRKTDSNNTQVPQESGNRNSETSSIANDKGAQDITKPKKESPLPKNAHFDAQSVKSVSISVTSRSPSLPHRKISHNWIIRFFSFLCTTSRPTREKEVT